MYSAIAVLISSALVLYFYYQMRGFISQAGLIFFIFSLGVVILRFYFINDIPTRFFDITSLAASTYYSFIIFIVFITVITMIFPHRLHVNTYSLKLFSGYLIWALFQQLFFQSVFYESLQNIINRQKLAVIITSFFYALFHLRPTFRKYLWPLFIINIFHTTIYSYFGNIIPLAINHALLGTYFFLKSSKSNQIALRLFNTDK